MLFKKYRIRNNSEKSQNSVHLHSATEWKLVWHIFTRALKYLRIIAVEFTKITYTFLFLFFTGHNNNYLFRFFLYGLLVTGGYLEGSVSCIAYCEGWLVEDCCIRLCGAIFFWLVFEDCVCWSSDTEFCVSKLSGVSGFSSWRWQAQHVGTCKCRYTYIYICVYCIL